MWSKDYPKAWKQFEWVFVKFTSKGHTLSTVFVDFLELSIASFSQNEEIYEEKIKRYTEEEKWWFAQALWELINVMTDSCIDNKLIAKDILWEFYESYITFGEHGQYFSPEHICEMMASIQTVDHQDTEKKITVMDPASWSWRMGLAMAKVFWKRNVHITLCDLDRRCALMATLNLLLNAIDGEVYCCNSLSMEMYDGWAVWLKFWALPYIKRINVSQMPEEKKTEILTQKTAQPSLF